MEKDLIIFTFHNVSINTGGGSTVVAGMTVFTFHNVSINTVKAILPDSLTTIFTFHNVSINTEIVLCEECTYMTLHSTMFLLIRN